MRTNCVALVGCLLLGLFACGDSSTSTVEAPRVSSLELELPTEILGLKVSREDMKSTLAQKKGDYWVHRTALFSMREGDLLRAALQVSRFRPSAPYKTAEFKRSVIGLIGGSAPEKIKVGESNLFVTTGNQQTVFVWFSGPGYFVLTTHAEYQHTRELVRQLLDLEPPI